MRTRSQARRRRQPQVRQTSVESSNLEKPDNPPIVTMADNRTMAQLRSSHEGLRGCDSSRLALPIAVDCSCLNVLRTFKTLIGKQGNIERGIVARTPLNEKLFKRSSSTSTKENWRPLADFCFHVKFTWITTCNALAILVLCEPLNSLALFSVGKISLFPELTQLNMTLELADHVLWRRDYLRSWKEEAITFNLDRLQNYTADYGTIWDGKQKSTSSNGLCDYSQEAGFSKLLRGILLLEHLKVNHHPPSQIMTKYAGGRERLKLCEAKTFESSFNEPPRGLKDEEKVALLQVSQSTRSHRWPLGEPGTLVPKKGENLMKHPERSLPFYSFMEQMLEKIAGNEIDYCFLDGFSGYFQIQLTQKIRKGNIHMPNTVLLLIVDAFWAMQCSGSFPMMYAGNLPRYD
ncbi:hypothetical protein Tco_1507783 [Tanacetum coccineum]